MSDAARDGRIADESKAGHPAWEPVWRGVAENEAHIIRGSLEADGIEAVVRGARREYALLAGSFDHGDYAVYVPRSRASQARQLLIRRGEGKDVVDESSGEDYATSAATVRFVAVGILVLVILTAIVYFATG